LEIRYLQKIGKRKTENPACFLFFFSDDLSVAAAVEAYDLFVSTLEDICLKAQSTIDMG
jgi:hypothetical protein